MSERVGRSAAPSARRARSLTDAGSLLLARAPPAAQVSLGVVTLLNCVPVHLGSAHQAGALTLFSVVLCTLHTCHVPHTGRMLARLRAVA